MAFLYGTEEKIVSLKIMTEKNVIIASIVFLVVKGIDGVKRKVEEQLKNLGVLYGR